MGEVLAGHRALAAGPPAAARAPLRATLCSSRAALRAFDAAWARLLAAAGGPGSDRAGAPEDEILDDLVRTARMALPRVG
ncbi:MAG: hypothetical protein QOE44_1216, partial [Solirubrobacteraceae bacterium]|nr:hypothetical protein [Solirubrobacteraceae bacterium]